MNLESFYNKYHLKNRQFRSIINQNNFTYFYILQFLQESFVKQFKIDYQKYLADKTVLDIGCGVGTLALYFAQFSKQVTGIDISQRAIKIASRARDYQGMDNVKFYQKQLHKIRGKFDLIICTEVIEHIKNDKQFLTDIRKRLRPDGVLLLTTPTSQNLLYRLGWYQGFDEEVGHIRRYTAKGLSRQMDKLGFEVRSIRQVEGPLRNILFTTKLGFLIRLVKGSLVQVFHLLDMISAKIFGAADIQVLATVKKGQTQ